MNRKLLATVVCSALGLSCAAAQAQDRSYRYNDDYTFRAGRAPEWNVGAADGVCRLRIWVDDKAKVDVRGDQIVVRTQSGKRSFDQGSVCNQPLPFQRVEDFRVSAERGRGTVFDVSPPTRRNNFTGSLTIDDPQSGGESYEVLVAWRNPDATPAQPLASNDPYPYFDETRACQDRVRGDFLARNRDGDAYLEFTGAVAREDSGPGRERIRGDAWARNRTESRPLSYECLLNDRTNRVLSSSYEVRPRGRYSSLQ
jgi:hypothetical protein